MTAAAVAVVALVGGCAGDGGPDGSERPGTGTYDDSTPLEKKPPASPSPGSGDVAVADSEACDEVRTGIAAFNAGQYDETVARFEAALPLAEEQDDGSVLAQQLVEAVRYYAELDAELYPEAARSSPEFAKYKAITLGQCTTAEGEPLESPGVDV